GRPYGRRFCRGDRPRSPVFPFSPVFAHPPIFPFQYFYNSKTSKLNIAFFKICAIINKNIAHSKIKNHENHENHENTNIERTAKMRNRLINTILIMTAYVLTCLAIFTGSYFQEALAVNVNQVSPVRVVATRDVENTVATQRNRDEAAARAAALPPVFAHDPTIDTQIFVNLYTIIYRLDEIRLEFEDWQEQQSMLQLAAYTQWQQQVAAWQQHLIQMGQLIAEGVDEDDITGPEQPSEEFEFERDVFPLNEHFTNFGVRLSNNQQIALISLSADDFDNFRYILHSTTENTIETPFETVNETILLFLQQNLEFLLQDVEIMQAAYAILVEVLMPNMIFNETADTGQREAMAAEYLVVYLQQDQLIVDAGEVISAEAYAIMQALGMLESEWNRDIIPLIGIYILVAVVMLTCCWFIRLYRTQIARRTKEALMLFSLYIGVLLVLWTMGSLSYYFMPVLAFTMLIAMLVNTRTAMVLNLGFTFIAYFVIEGTLHYILFFVLTGSIMSLLARYTIKRNHIMAVSVFAALFSAIIAVAISLTLEPHQVVYSPNLLINLAAIAALNGFLTVILSIGSLPVWEAVFGMVTPIKLMDLTNPTNPLMRRLTIEAPGTYHHSLIVANLAETAAYDINANPHIARAGGYYHDVGKLKHPQYFAENITGLNPHDALEPINSVRIIVSHVEHGLVLATENRLPQILHDIIREHHGTGLIKFFYHKAKELEKAKDSPAKLDKKDFSYPFNIPQSKESALVMLADGVEATVRSMMANGADVGAMDTLISKMIKDRLTDGSLSDSNLSIKDVDAVANSFYRVLKGMYHERIPYPDDPAVAVERR
ncbi:MAG: HDIG domain-containing protein, partial [Defluviitaleaceae bacterium]|nr:HDIG domain-containing protein [Defluviitaleaceae bacterium]